jgi:CRP/FNR family transcriptional regulator, cyclic AMP receptor protein
MIATNLLRGEKDIRRFPAGAALFNEGAPADGMYSVLEGEVDILMQGQVRETVQPGGIFGELSLLDEQPRSATAVARTDTTVAVVNARRFEALVQHAPYFAVHVMRIMAERLRRKN